MAPSESHGRVTNGSKASTSHLPARWRTVFSVATLAVAVAVAYRIQQHPLLRPSGDEPATFCYQRVRTHDEAQPSAQCFTVSDGRFQRVWTAHLDGELSDDKLTRSSGYAMPGLWDGHGHLLQYGEFLHSVDLFGAQTLDEVRDRVAAYVVRHPTAGTKNEWIRGVGWDQMSFGRMPTADDLEVDARLKGMYMMLDRVDVHCSWVSQPILDLLPREIPDVPGGEVIRNPGMGVFCDNAMDMVTAIWPQPDRQTKAAMVRDAMAQLNSLGIVGMHDAGATPGTLSLYSEMADSNDWTVRVYSMLECDKRNAYCPDDAVKVDRADGFFTVRSVKLFADGALGSWGSAMIEPYTDHPWTSGSLLINASDLTQVTHQWAAAGYQVNIHAIGDMANRNAVDAFESALRQLCPPSADPSTREVNLARCQAAHHRFRIEHSQIIHSDDQKRMHALGILPSIQPTHATSDMKYAADRLGPDRTNSEAYRMRSLLPLNLVLGSDFPVEPADPFQGIFAAVARRSPHTGRGADGGPDGWHMAEALSIDQALRGFTLGPAHGSFMEDRAGVIKEGAFADWVVVDAPVEELDVEDLRTFRVRETWAAGRRVYNRDN